MILRRGEKQNMSEEDACKREQHEGINQSISINTLINKTGVTRTAAASDFLRLGVRHTHVYAPLNVISGE